MALAYDFGSDEFDKAMYAAGRRALEEMEQPDGRRFEIRWIPGAPSGQNYEIIREVNARAA